MLNVQHRVEKHIEGLPALPDDIKLVGPEAVPAQPHQAKSRPDQDGHYQGHVTQGQGKKPRQR